MQCRTTHYKASGDLRDTVERMRGVGGGEEAGGKRSMRERGLDGGGRGDAQGEGMPKGRRGRLRGEVRISWTRQTERSSQITVTVNITQVDENL